MTTPARRLPRLALLGVFAAALALGACGRKGALDLPPASVASPAPASTDAAARDEGFDAEGNPVAARGARKPFALDWLLN